MKAKTFGITNQITIRDNNVDKYVEELSILGYCIIENVLSQDELNIAKVKLDDVYTVQTNECSINELESINELYLARLPFVYDAYFLNLITNDVLLDVVKKVLGSYFILHLQNGIINMPQQTHHQNSWHRDLPYQDFISSWKHFAKNVFERKN
ncbi:MAG: hypothetical protein H0X33_07135 [Taibaiella sp.]|nr:hypothetical protein [Taibaiella sp.]